MSLLRIENIQPSQKKVLLRCDFSAENGRLQRFQLKSFIPTIEFLLQKNSSVIILSHCNDKQSYSSLVSVFADELKKTVEFASDLSIAREKALSLQSGQILLIENLSLLSGELQNDPAFASEIAKLGDLFINDAFDACCEEMATIMHLPSKMESAIGLHLYQEITAANSVFSPENKPFTVILGGTGLGPKLKLMQKFLTNRTNRVANILIGGALTYTFLKSRALPIGNSIYEGNLEVDAFQTVEKCELMETELILPLDHIAADQISRTAKTKSVKTGDIPAQWRYLDIGSKTISQFEKAIKNSSLVFWYGPMGVTEIDQFQSGTKNLGKILSKAKARKILAGTETTRFMAENGMISSMDHASSSSRAFLSIIMGNDLLGIKALSQE